MQNKGKCINVRIAITKDICEDFRGRGARICDGCPGPEGAQRAEDALDVPTVASADADELPALVKEQPAPVASASILDEPSLPPGFYVDFTGCEDILHAWTSAATERGLDPGAAALDIIYLFTEGLLRLKRKP